MQGMTAKGEVREATKIQFQPLLPNTHARTCSKVILENQKHDQVIPLSITLHGSPIGQSSSPCHSSATTTTSRC